MERRISEKLFRDNLEMFNNVKIWPVSPWILFDFSSPYRFHPTNQEGWNLKGLISDQGFRKRLGMMKEFYNNK